MTYNVWNVSDEKAWKWHGLTARLPTLYVSVLSFMLEWRQCYHLENKSADIVISNVTRRWAPAATSQFIDADDIISLPGVIMAKK